MLLPPFLALGYAETHYKFRLPWSPLHEPWPEIFLDAPCLLEVGRAWPVWLVLRDADLFPTTIHEIHASITSDGIPDETLIIPLELKCQDAFHFIPLQIPLRDRKGRVHVQIQIKAERNGTFRSIRDWNYPGLAPSPLMVQVLEFAYPKPEGWWAGETHCHTWHSSDPVEFGAPPSVLQAAAYALGLDFVLTTDHSYDFCFRNDNYNKPADPKIRWQQLQQEIESLDSYPFILPGEEVSCGNAHGENIHLLVPGHSDYIPGIGDSGRQWFANHPTQPISQVLEKVAPIPCFAAHPQSKISWLERKVFRRGPFTQQDLHLSGKNPVAGLEFWNGAQDQGYYRGKRFWIDQLLAGHRLLPIAGNDAHGDLNRFTAVHIPLLKLHASRQRLFGKVRTVLEGASPSIPNHSNLHASIWNAQLTGNLYCSDGPSIQISKDPSKFRITCDSTADFGAIAEVRIFWSDFLSRKEQEECLKVNTMHFLRDWPIPRQFQYLRIECRTDKNFQAISAANWAD